MPLLPARLKQRRDFVHLARRGHKAVTPGLILQALPRGDSSLRVGFTASKKVGNAVARNRAKRRLRALAAQMLPTGWDFVLIARTATVTRPFALLRRDLARALVTIDDGDRAQR